MVHEDGRPAWTPTVGGASIGAVAHDHGGVGVPAAHHPAVAPEDLDLAALGDGRPGHDGRGQLHPLAPDAR